MWELSRIKRQPLISDIPKGEIGSAQQRWRKRERERGKERMTEEYRGRKAKGANWSGGEEEKTSAFDACARGSMVLN